MVKAQPYVAWVKHYGPENGLAHREVNAIIQDRQGFMWFGTKFGLSRFDGKTFTTFTKEHNGLDFDDIRSFAQDAGGNLWLMGPGGQNNITIFNPLTNKATSFASKFAGELPSESLNDLGGLSNNDNGTVFLTNYRTATLVSYHPASGLRSVPVPQFKTLGVFRATAHNTVWAIADEHQLVELTADGRILHQFSHRQNELISWHLGQRNAGIEFFYSIHNPTKKAVQREFYSIDERARRQQWPSAMLDAMVRYMGPVCYPIDRSGLIWDGISLRDSTNGTRLTIADQTSGETIENRSFYRDRNGLLWLGTSFGIYQVKLTPNYFHRLLYEPTNKGRQVAAIRGITVLGDQVFANLEKFGSYVVPRQGGIPEKLYGNSVFVYGLAQDRLGKLYAGDVNQIVRYEPLSRGVTRIPLPTGSEGWSFYPLDTNRWLVGTQRGLRLIDAKNRQSTLFSQYNQFAELAQGHVLHIGSDRQGAVWICATTGLYRIDSAKGVTARYWSGGKGEFYLPADSYQHFYQRTDGTYWLATANAGLIRWDKQHNQHRQFKRSEGLSNDNIYAVYSDRRGYLWLSSDYGIMQFDPVHLSARTYFVQDGITHNEFNRVAHTQDKAGRIYFGGLNGITWFDPRDFEREKSSAQLSIRLVSFRQLDKASNRLIDKTAELSQRHQIVIRPGDQTSVLDFALLNFADAEKNVYAYQFKGLDNEWTQQSESSLRLGNLPYGTYQLLIKGQAANGQWSANVLSLEVVVERPFYLQIWFLMLSALLTIAGIWGWLKWRIWNHQHEQLRLQSEIRQATARIEQDKELIEQQAQTLHQLNETKSRFFANISHEFRTPLTVILGMAAELQQENTPEKGLGVWRAGRLIERNGSNLLRLINQILDLSRLEAGEMHVQPIRADLIQFTRYVAESFQTMAALKGVALHFHADRQTLEIDFDKDKLQDILSNLLTNAIKFTPTNGRIDLELVTRQANESLDRQGYYEAITPIRHPEESWLSIRVRDTGSGIEPDTLPKIFDRFFQRSASVVVGQPVSEVGGTGIGLSLVRELVQLMQGGLAVRSLPGQGTEFIIQLRQTRNAPLVSLPVTDSEMGSPNERDEMEPTEEASNEKPVLLLVEDNEDVAHYIISCIQTEYRVIRVEDGQKGIDLAIDSVPDLILSDVMMPEKDGFQVCDTLKNDPRTSHIPIVLLTARAAFSDRIAGLRRGADAYLTKPFQREELVVVLRNLLRNRRLLQARYSQLALQPTPAELLPASDNDSLEDQFLHRLRATLEPQLDHPDFSIEALCQQIGMSRTSLHLKMVALTGMSITRYVRSLRLNKAKELLINSDLNVSEVAYAVGFQDPKYFSRVFSEESGISPANFRLSAQTEQ